MTDLDTASQFSNVLERIIATLEEENGALRARRPERVAMLQARKTMVLYELDRLGKTSAGLAGARPERADRLRRLLDENLRLLQSNIAALEEVIDTMKQIHLREESDGTYSATSVTAGAQR